MAREKPKKHLSWVISGNTTVFSFWQEKLSYFASSISSLSVFHVSTLGGSSVLLYCTVL